MLSKLCAQCELIFENWQSYIEFTIYQLESLPRHHTISDLKSSADEGCHLCILFYVYHLQNFSTEHPWDAPLRVFILGPKLPGSDRDWTLNLWTNNKTVSSMMINPIEGKSLLSLSDPGEVQRPTPSNSTGSDEVWSQVDMWYKRCITSHKKCISTVGSTLPTRLLDLQTTVQGKDIRLCSSINLAKEIRYATLSHRWGSLPILKLKRENVEDLQRGILLNELCKTFQDAVAIARRYKIQYLWIDSLCIMQDDDDDWKFESLLMSDIYGSSILNIAAAGALDGRGGCFFKRYPPASRVCHVKINDGKSSDVFYEVTPVRLYHEFVSATPLGKRAWAFQERFLAPRTIHCGTSQIFWHCEETDACEMYAEGLPVGFRSDIAYQDKTLSPNLWPSILAQYTRCFLTFEKDKLPAISGIAKWLASQSGDDYLAGLWRRDLELQLLWHQAGDWPEEPRRCVIYRAPSWSWASMDGAVAYSKQDASPKQKLCIRILHVNVSTVTDDSFGEVSSGLIRLTCGRILEGKVLELTPRKHSYGSSGIKLGRGAIIYPWTLPSPIEDTETPVCLLPIQDSFIPAVRDDTGKKDLGGIRGLILRPTGSAKGQFRRISFFSVHQDDCERYKAAEIIPDVGIPESAYEEILDGDENSREKYIITIV